MNVNVTPGSIPNAPQPMEWPEGALTRIPYWIYHSPDIYAREQQRIFEPLVRGHATIAERRDRGGLGLGLYICREIVRAHDGTMAVESSATGGTTFSVLLPR